MSEEMINIYKKLNTNEKRNEFSQLLIKLDNLTDILMNLKNIELSKFKSAKNYNSMEQTLQTEDDVLLFFYDDIWNIKEKLLALISNTGKE